MTSGCRLLSLHAAHGGQNIWSARASVRVRARAQGRTAMGAIVSKLPLIVPQRAPQQTARKSRVARVTAKRPKRSEEPEVEAELDEEEEVAEKPARPDNGTYLSMYFRDMAELDVLRPEEEFTSAREIEALEIMLWEAVLSHPQ